MSDSGSPPKVLSVGRLYCDLIFTDLPRMPSLGTEVFAGGFSAHAGGGAFITAAHLADLGCSSALAAMLPSSAFTDLMRDEISASGVDLSLCRPLPVEDGPQLTVAMVHAGERAFLTRRAGPAVPDITADLLRTSGARHLHIGELASLVAHASLLAAARQAGVTVSLDCSWDEGLTAQDIKPFLGGVDVFLPNDSELRRLHDLGLTTPMAPLTIVKRGASGASAMSPEGCVDVPTEPIEALDTTGAGDAFNAGFLAAWLNNAPLKTCLNEGNARGALAVRQRGGFAAETQRKQKGYSNG